MISSTSVVQQDFTAKEIVLAFMKISAGSTRECNICAKHWENIDVKKKGFQNLASHVKIIHKNYAILMTASNEARLLKGHFTAVSDEAHLYFKWIEWVVMNNLSLQFVDDELNRSNSNLAPICSKALIKHIFLLREEVKNI
jgi:hypothetical protein